MGTEVETVFILTHLEHGWDSGYWRQMCTRGGTKGAREVHERGTRGAREGHERCTRGTQKEYERGTRGASLNLPTTEFTSKLVLSFKLFAVYSNCTLIYINYYSLYSIHQLLQSYLYL